MIHYDSNCIVFICYLSRNYNFSGGGTEFYHHKVLKRKKISPKSDVKNYLIDNTVWTATHHHYEEWVKWHEVFPSFNKAIIFDGHLFHSGPQKQEETSRITLDLFIKRDNFFEA